MSDRADDSDDELRPRTGPFVRAVWWLISVLAAILLLALVAIASTAILSPDAFVDSCHRTQLVTPLGCRPESMPRTASPSS